MAHRIDRCIAHTHGVSCAQMCEPENIPRNIPVPWGHPQNIPRTKNSQTRMIAWFPENIPNIPKIPTPFGIPGIRLSHAYLYISKVKFNVSL